MFDKFDFMEDLRTLKNFGLAAPEPAESDKTKDFEERTGASLPPALKMFYEEISISNLNMLSIEITILDINQLTLIYDKEYGQGILFAKTDYDLYAYFAAENKIMQKPTNGFLWGVFYLSCLEEFLVYFAACGLIEQMSECVLVGLKKQKKSDTIEEVTHMKCMKCNENPNYLILFDEEKGLLGDYDLDRRIKYRIASNIPTAIDSIAMANTVLWKKHDGHKVLPNHPKSQSGEFRFEDKLQIIHKAFLPQSKSTNITRDFKDIPRKLKYFYSLIHENQIFKFSSEGDTKEIVIAYDVRDNVTYSYDLKTKFGHIESESCIMDFSCDLESLLIYLACRIAQEEAPSAFNISLDEFEKIEGQFFEFCKTQEFACYTDIKQKLLMICERSEGYACISAKNDNILKELEIECDLYADWN